MVNIVDGDTIDVRAPDGTQERVRLIGIDTPERGECGYGEASIALADLIAGQDVELVPGAADNRDRYDRLLRYVDVDGTDAGHQLLEQGLAIARYDSRDGYGLHPREADYVAADEAAENITCAAPPPPPAPEPDEPAGGNPWGTATCHPAYDPCVPPPPEVGDLDCPDIKAKYSGGVGVNHAHGDPHRLDRDKDGHGCE